VVQGLSDGVGDMVKEFELMNDDPTADEEHGQSPRDCEKPEQIRGNPKDS
jgi:hypothetical protein